MTRNDLKSMKNYMRLSLSSNPHASNQVLKVGDIVMWNDPTSVKKQHRSMVIGFSKSRQSFDGYGVHFAGEEYMTPHDPSGLLATTNLNTEEQDIYMDFLQYEVKASSVSSFLADGVLPELYSDAKDPSSKEKLLTEKTAELSRMGFCMISRGVSVTGETMAYFGA